MKNNLFKSSFELFANNHMVIQPLFVGVLVIMYVLLPLSSKNSLDVGAIFTIIIAVLCMTAFLSGWYNCVKKSVSFNNKKYENQEQKNQDNFEILKSFFPGVSEYIVPVTSVAFIYVAFFFGLFKLYKIYSLKIFTAQNIPDDIFMVLSTISQSAVGIYLKNNFTAEQIHSIMSIIGTGVILFFLFNVFVLWFGPAIYFSI